MPKQFYSKKITFEVISKGRKYFKIRYSSDHNPFQLAINEITKDLQVGQVVENLLCEFDYQRNSYSGGGKTTAIAVEAEDLIQRQEEAKEAERQWQVARWRGFVESALNENRIYAKGFETLRGLGFDTSEYDAKVAEINDRIKQSEIERWSGYCEAAALEGREYGTGLQKLRSLGRADLVDQYRQQACEVQESNRRTAQEQAAEKQGNAAVERGVVSYWFGSPAWNSADELTHLQVGDVYKGKDGNYYKILTRFVRRVREDGLCFGLASDEGEIVTGNSRLATSEEFAPLVAAEAAERERRAESHRRATERSAIAKHIQEHGDCPAEGSLRRSQNRLLDSSDVYGGGDWFAITETEIWYVLNNGGDGDDWSCNNLPGAIGTRIPFDRAIADRILALESDVCRG